MRKLAVYGTPITPTAAVEQLVGASFCVSFFHRAKLRGQLEQLIRLTGEDGMLLVDNGAFSHWRRNQANPGPAYWTAFEAWAYDILRRCPQAVVVAPDAIDAPDTENAALLLDFVSGPIPRERTMPVWHLGDSLEYLAHLLESGYSYLAFGSSGAYRVPGTHAWHRRLGEAFAVVARCCAPGTGNPRPWLHLLRAQACHHLWPFESSDSTNLAQNHARHRNHPGHLRLLAERLEHRLGASCDGCPQHPSPALQAIAAREDALVCEWLASASPAELRSYLDAGVSPVEVRVPDYSARAISDGAVPLRPRETLQCDLFVAA